MLQVLGFMNARSSGVFECRCLCVRACDCGSNVGVNVGVNGLSSVFI